MNVMTAIRAAALTLGMTAAASAEPRVAEPSGVIELRQYRIVPGQRDAFVALFDRAFVETQEAEGMRLVGQFRDLDDPDRFVWLRGFPDMEARRHALEAFYSGPTWRRHRGTANSMMIDSDNVLLLRPAWPGAGFVVPPRPREADEAARAMIVATILYLWKRPGEGFSDFFRSEVRPALEAAGIPVLAALAPETGANDFPRLPVRPERHLFVWFTRFGSEAEQHERMVRLGASADWRERVAPALRTHLERAPQVLRLAATPRSALR